MIKVKQLIHLNGERLYDFPLGIILQASLALFSWCEIEEGLENDYLSNILISLLPDCFNFQQNILT